MAEENSQDPPEITLESLADVAVADLNDDQKAVITASADKLTDEQKETYKDILTPPDETIDVSKVEPETRSPAQIKKDEKEEEETEDEDNEVTPEDEKAISKIVDKKVGDKLKKLEEMENKSEVDSFIVVKPEFGKYREVALKYMNHPAYANIPIHNIMAIVASKDLQKLGAEKEREAQKKAKDTQGGGSSVREPAKGTVDWSKATKEQLHAKQAEVMGQQG
jgi:hypothetical protein